MDSRIGRATPVMMLSAIPTFGSVMTKGPSGHTHTRIRGEARISVLLGEMATARSPAGSPNTMLSTKVVFCTALSVRPVHCGNQTVGTTSRNGLAGLPKHSEINAGAATRQPTPAPNLSNLRHSKSSKRGRQITSLGQANSFCRARV